MDILMLFQMQSTYGGPDLTTSIAFFFAVGSLGCWAVCPAQSFEVFPITPIIHVTNNSAWVHKRAISDNIEFEVVSADNCMATVTMKIVILNN